MFIGPLDESSSFFVGLTGRLEAFWIIFLMSLFFLELAIMLFGILHFAFVSMTLITAIVWLSVELLWSFGPFFAITAPHGASLGAILAWTWATLSFLPLVPLTTIASFRAPWTTPITMISVSVISVVSVVSVVSLVSVVSVVTRGWPSFSSFVTVAWVGALPALRATLVGARTRASTAFAVAGKVPDLLAVVAFGVGTAPKYSAWLEEGGLDTYGGGLELSLALKRPLLLLHSIAISRPPMFLPLSASLASSASRSLSNSMKANELYTRLQMVNIIRLKTLFSDGWVFMRNVTFYLIEHLPNLLNWSSNSYCLTFLEMFPTNKLMVLSRVYLNIIRFYCSMS